MSDTQIHLVKGTFKPFQFGSPEARAFVASGLAVLPFEKRHRWLTIRGWVAAPVMAGAKRMYTNPADPDHMPVCQTDAVKVQFTLMMHERGLFESLAA